MAHIDPLREGHCETALGGSGGGIEPLRFGDTGLSGNPPALRNLGVGGSPTTSPATSTTTSFNVLEFRVEFRIEFRERATRSGALGSGRSPTTFGSFGFGGRPTTPADEPGLRGQPATEFFLNT